MSENKKPISGKTYHSIRIVVGLYLLYTDYSLIRDFNTMDKKYEIFFIICMIAFAGAGIALLFFSGKSLITLMREDQNQDDMEEPEEQEEIEVENLEIQDGQTEPDNEEKENHFTE